MLFLLINVSIIYYFVYPHASAAECAVANEISVLSAIFTKYDPTHFPSKKIEDKKIQKNDGTHVTIKFGILMKLARNQYENYHSHFSNFKLSNSLPTQADKN